MGLLQTLKLPEGAKNSKKYIQLNYILIFRIFRGLVKLLVLQQAHNLTILK
jgi:hypothetical protein